MSIDTLGTSRCYLTHWGRDKMNAISQTTFSSAFSWMKIFEFRLKFHWSFFPKGSINIPALVQIMAWRRSGDKPLSEPMMVNLPTHICVTRPQWVKKPSSGPQNCCWDACIWCAIIKWILDIIGFPVTSFCQNKVFIYVYRKTSVSLFLPKLQIDSVGHQLQIIVESLGILWGSFHGIIIESPWSGVTL